MINKVIFILWIISLFFLSACYQIVYETDQSIIDLSNKTNETNKTANNAEVNVISEQKTNESKESVKTAEQKYQIIDPAESNASVSSNLPAKKWIKGATHIIEVVDVTEDSNACIIKVDGISDLIKVGETKTLNGVKIYVAEARIFNSMTEDKDICELVIA